MAGQFLDPSNDTGPDYLFLIFSQFSQIFSHERKCDKKNLSNFAKLQLIMDKVYSPTNKATWQFGKIDVLVNFIIQELKF